MNVYVFKSLPPFLWGYTRDIRALAHHFELDELRLKLLVSKRDNGSKACGVDIENQA